MAPSLIDGDLAMFREAQEAQMPDTCVTYARSEGAPDARGVRTPTYTPRAILSCGLAYRTSESHNADDTRNFSDAEMRLPWDSTITTLDHVEVTHRHGTALVPTLTFEVVGTPMYGPSAVVVRLRRMQL